MLTRLQVENFKAWRQADVGFGKITGFFGTNSAGKSSLLHHLLLLKQTRNATDRKIVLEFGGSKDIVSLGTFADVVHGHDPDRRIEWSVDWNLPRPLSIPNPSGPSGATLWRSNTMRIRCGVRLEGGRLVSEELAYALGDARFRLRAGTGNQLELVSEAPNFSFLRNRGRPWTLSPTSKGYLFPSEAKARYQNAAFLSDLELAYERFMDSIYYLGPLREDPRRQYHWSGSSPEDVGRRGERAIDAILSATARNERRSLGHWKHKKPFQAMIAHWLRELGLIADFELEEIAAGSNLYRANVRTSGSSVPTALTDVGFGVSQVLPVVVLLYFVPEGSTVLLEQPEIHLHPAVQSGLADVMLNVVEARNLQIIFESHSEHLMRRLQRRVAEGTASAEDVRLYFVCSEKGGAQLSDLNLNEWGEIENWPESFFGDEMGEIAAITEASLRKRLDHAG